MIHESCFWKEPLLDSALRFKEYRSYFEIDEETYVKIEKDIFIGFYSIRKLIDTETKVTDALKAEKHLVQWYAHIGDNVTWRNNHKLDLLYDLNKSHSEKRDLWFLSSRIIHSFIFELCINKNGGFDGILFTSDTDKNKKLYMLNLTQLIELFELVGNNYVEELHWQKRPEMGKELTCTK